MLTYCSSVLVADRYGFGRRGQRSGARSVTDGFHMRSRILLDCEFCDTALQSVAELFHYRSRELLAAFARRIGAYFEKIGGTSQISGVLVEVVEKNFGCARPLDGDVLVSYYARPARNHFFGGNPPSQCGSALTT